MRLATEANQNAIRRLALSRDDAGNGRWVMWDATQNASEIWGTVSLCPIIGETAGRTKSTALRVVPFRVDSGYLATDAIWRPIMASSSLASSSVTSPVAKSPKHSSIPLIDLRQNQMVS